MVAVVVSDSMFFTLLHPPDTSSESLKGKQKLKAKQKTKMQKKGTPRRTVLRPVLRGYLGGYLGGYLEGPLCVGWSETATNGRLKKLVLVDTHTWRLRARERRP